MGSSASRLRVRLAQRGRIADVKRMRPAMLGPFDYTEAQHQPSLWVAEGWTNYYGNVALHRAGVIERPLTITQVTRSRVQELKQVRREYYAYTGVTMTDLVDFCLELGLEQLKRRGYKVDVPLLGLDGKQLEGPELWMEMTPSEA